MNWNWLLQGASVVVLVVCVGWVIRRRSRSGSAPASARATAVGQDQPAWLPQLLDTVLYSLIVLIVVYLAFNLF